MAVFTTRQITQRHLGARPMTAELSASWEVPEMCSPELTSRASATSTTLLNHLRLPPAIRYNVEFAFKPGETCNARCIRKPENRRPDPFRRHHWHARAEHAPLSRAPRHSHW